MIRPRTPSGPRSLAPLLALVPTLAGCGPGGADRPNVVLITLDTTRADRFGCYGYPEDTTPNFDALGAEGAIFDLCISTAAVTPVSHASILTGLYQYTHGLRVMMAPSGYRISERVQTLPEILRAKGWRTGAFLSSYPVSEVFGFDRGFDAFDWPEPAVGEQATLQNDAGAAVGWNSENQRRSDVTVERAIDWVATDPDEPFFLWMHFWDPHGGSAHPPEDILREMVPSFDPEQPGKLSPQARLAYYAAQVHMVDRQFGRLVEHLKATGAYDDTLIVVTADHGEGLGQHGWHAHRILYQEQIRLPLLMRGPGVPGGRRVEDLVRSIDITPTILEAVDVAPENRLEGVSVLPLLRGEESAPRIAYAEQLNALDLNAKMVQKRPQADLLHVVMNGEWKLIHRPNPKWGDELYHIATDPHETRNLIGQGHPAERELMQDLVERDVFRSKPFEPSASGAAPDLDALRALGYLGDEADESSGEDAGTGTEEPGEGRGDAAGNGGDR